MNNNPELERLPDPAVRRLGVVSSAVASLEVIVSGLFPLDEPKVPDDAQLAIAQEASVSVLEINNSTNVGDARAQVERALL